MTTKTIKTILFASLIAAMILPFSGMGFAQAEMSDDKKQQLMAKVISLEEKIAQAESESLKESLKAKQQEILKELFDSIPQSDTQFTVGEPEVTIESGGLITVDGIYTGCNGSGVNWNFAAQTYSSSTWWNVNHYFPNAISVGTSPNCTGANWDNNLYIESKELLSGKGCHTNLTVGAISSYWLNCKHIMDGIVLSEIKADYVGYPTEITGYHWQYI